MNNLLKTKRLFFILIAVTWSLLGTFLYTDYLIHYDKSYIEYYNIRFAHDFFSFKEDEYRKNDALSYAKSNGHESRAKYLMNLGFKFFKPVCNRVGYILFILLPLTLLWIIFFSTFINTVLFYLGWSLGVYIISILGNFETGWMIDKICLPVSIIFFTPILFFCFILAYGPQLYIKYTQNDSSL